jgi:hypothetical protein
MIRVKLTIGRKSGSAFLSIIEHIHEQYEGLFDIEIEWDELILHFTEEKDKWEREDILFFRRMQEIQMITSYIPILVPARGRSS